MKHPLTLFYVFDAIKQKQSIPFKSQSIWHKCKLPSREKPHRKKSIHVQVWVQQWLLNPETRAFQEQYLSESCLVWEHLCSITPKVHLNNPHYSDIQYLQTVIRASGQMHTGRMMDCANHSTRRHRFPPNPFRLKYNYIGNQFLLQICSEWTLDCTQHCFTVLQQEKNYHYL